MKAILDTHALIWAVDNPQRLGARALEVLSDPGSEILFSSGSLWELAIKVGLGKLALSFGYDRWMRQAIRDLRLTVLPITVECAAMQSNLVYHHRDPFDRLLVAHSLVEKASLISSDLIFDRYQVNRIW